MNIFLLSDIITTIGTLMVSYVAIMVHHRVLKEHSVNSKEVREGMINERRIGIAGMALIIIGFIIRFILSY